MCLCCNSSDVLKYLTLCVETIEKFDYCVLEVAMKRILFSGDGSSGDLLPMVLMAREFKRAGYEDDARAIDR